MNLSEADYMKILKYIASKSGQKVVKHNGFIYVVAKDTIVNDSHLRIYRSTLTAKTYFNYIHAKVIMQVEYYSNSLWLLSPEELLVQADLEQ